MRHLWKAQLSCSRFSELKTGVRGSCVTFRAGIQTDADDDGPDMYAKALEGDLKKYKEIAASESFADFYQNYRNLSYDRLASSRGFDGNEEKLELVKKLREMGKDAVKKINRQYFFTSPEIMAEQMKKTAPMAAELVRLTLEFDETFTAEKRRKNLVDFHDLEHFALNIFVDEETGKIKKTAEEFRDNFKEIMIDEYQDSNEVQETILRAISREERGEYNLFMVGDVKQSIYRFRLARPELFMEKYDTYSLMQKCSALTCIKIFEAEMKYSIFPTIFFTAS